MKLRAFLRCLTAGAISGLALLPGTSGAQTVPRVETYAIESFNLTDKQFFSGDLSGKPVTLAGELRIPTPGTSKLPAIVFMETAGGIGPAEQQWLYDFNAAGIATFAVDSFSGRGITNGTQPRPQRWVMMVDAYRALAVLAHHPRIDPARIAIMGGSYGAQAAVFSSSKRFVKMYAEPGTHFAAHIGIYANCDVHYRDWEVVTGAPIRIFDGALDQSAVARFCVTYVEQVRRTGGNAKLTVFPGTYHAFDYQNVTTIATSIGPNTGACALVEDANGTIVDGKTGAVFDPATNPCVVNSFKYGYNAAAYQGTRTAILAFLKSTFNRK